MKARPLAVIIGTTAHDRAHAALSLAAASAALGRDVALYLHADAARLMDAAFHCAEDARFAAAGVPTIGELLASVIELGVAITICQTGLALNGLAADTLPGPAEAGGLVDFLARMGAAEIVLG